MTFAPPPPPGMGRATLTGHRRPGMTPHPKDDILDKIARDTLGIETLATRNRSADDLHEVAIWNIKAALEAAFAAGCAARKMTVAQ